MNSPPPVKHLVVLTHPDPGSFCASVALRWQQRARANHQTCDLRDLYADGFDPVLKATEQPGKPGFAPVPDILLERDRLQQVDVLVFVYPVWFGAPPAMLKGYIERVVGSGVSFHPQQTEAKLFERVRLVQIASSASEEPWLAEKGVRGALHTIYDQYLSDLFGARQVYRVQLDSISEGMSAHHAAVQLSKVEELADRVCADANADRWERAIEMTRQKTGGCAPT